MGNRTFNLAMYGYCLTSYLRLLTLTLPKLLYQASNNPDGNHVPTPKRNALHQPPNNSMPNRFVDILEAFGNLDLLPEK